MKRTTRETLDIVHDEGFEVLSLEQGGRHMQAWLKAPDGRTTKVSISSAKQRPKTDLLNFRSRLRLFKKAGGSNGPQGTP